MVFHQNVNNNEQGRGDFNVFIFLCIKYFTVLLQSEQMIELFSFGD